LCERAWAGKHAVPILALGDGMLADFALPVILAEGEFKTFALWQLAT
jgi:hypothetical protein